MKSLNDLPVGAHCLIHYDPESQSAREFRGVWVKISRGETVQEHRWCNIQTGRITTSSYLAIAKPVIKPLVKLLEELLGIELSR